MSLPVPRCGREQRRPRLGGVRPPAPRPLPAGPAGSGWPSASTTWRLGHALCPALWRASRGTSPSRSWASPPGALLRWPWRPGCRDGGGVGPCGSPCGEDVALVWTRRLRTLALLGPGRSRGARAGVLAACRRRSRQQLRSRPGPVDLACALAAPLERRWPPVRRARQQRLARWHQRLSASPGPTARPRPRTTSLPRGGTKAVVARRGRTTTWPAWRAR